MPRTTGPAMPAGVKLLRKRIDEWRRTRDRRTAMPADLWQEAVALARPGRAWAVARALRVNFQALQRRIAETAPGAPGPGAATGTFVELSGAQILRAAGGATGTVVELSDAGGIRMIVRVAAGAALDVPRLVAAFRGVGA
ncbi:MAG: hypothetical protein HY825_15600 [Acidobacteria bacterium]|nr:hypothetical protein [Acidobacteriota bacterium]